MAKTIVIMKTHPLGDLSRVVQTARDTPDLWLQVNGTAIRRRNVRVQLKKMETREGVQDLLCLSCTLPAGERESLEKHFEFLKNYDRLEMQGIREETSTAAYQTFDRKDDTYKDTTKVKVGKARTFKDATGKISLTVGSNKEQWNQYEKISLQVDPSVSAQELHAFLSAMGLPTMMLQSRPEDIYHENLARVTHALYPKEFPGATPEEMIRMATGNQKVDAIARHKVSEIQQRARNMRLKDVRKGRTEYVDSEAIREFWNAGGRGFASTLGHAGLAIGLRNLVYGDFFEKQNINDSAQTLGHILKGGMMSTFERFEKGIIGAGNAPEENIRTGSANQVFARLLTDNQFDVKHDDVRHDWMRYAIEGNIFLLMDARLAERLPYAYLRDRAGLRNPTHESDKTIRMAQKEGPEMGLHGELMKERVTLAEICNGSSADFGGDKSMQIAEN
ncbi:MAG: hypothetical protein WB791_08425 [Waddliaceae bacterium]